MITLTTDFGLSDEYVGVMKGVILARAPAVRLVDISHGIPPQDIRRAAFMVKAFFPFFPAGTIHLVVVDPGVGSARKVIVVKAAGQFFVAPDNGVLSFLFAESFFEAAHGVACADLFLQPVSPTFHGRDIMAPVAAHLAMGLPMAEVGPLLPLSSLVRLPMPEILRDRLARTITGSVVAVDHFGNLLTDISEAEVFGTAPRPVQEPAFPVMISIGEQTIRGLVKSYAQGGAGELLAVISSRNSLEIAVNGGNAAQQLGVGPGERVCLAFIG